MCQRVHAFVKSPWPVLMQIFLRRILQSCFAFLKAFSVQVHESFPVRTLHLFTCIKSQVLLYLRHTFFLNLRHISFVSGRLPKVDQFMVCQSGGKFEPPNFKKSHCVHIAKHMIFFGEALVVMCTLNLKIKIFNLSAF